MYVLTYLQKPNDFQCHYCKEKLQSKQALEHHEIKSHGTLKITEVSLF